MRELLACPSGREKELAEVPGVFFRDRLWYIPNNLYEAGLRRSGIFDYEEDPMPTTPSGLPLKSYQRRIVTALRQVTPEQGGAFNGGDPGLGKSISTLQTLWLDGFLQRRGLICGPLGSKETWCSNEGDPLVHYGLRITPLSGTKATPKIFLGDKKWFFIHWEVLAAWQMSIFHYLKPAALIIDESHELLNLHGKRSKAMHQISKMASIERRLLLTGTPFTKTRMDIYAQLNICQPNQWAGQEGSRRRFGIRYAGGHLDTVAQASIEAKTWMVYDGQTHSDELRARLAGCYLRYTKADVPGELPKLTRKRIDVKLDFDLKERYRGARADAVGYLKKRRGDKDDLPSSIQIGDATYKIPKGKTKGEPLIITTALREVLSEAKELAAPQIAYDLSRKHRKLVIFTWMRRAAKSIHSHLDAMLAFANEGTELFGPIDGNDKMPKRYQTCSAFANSKAPNAILVATRGALGISINHLKVADACLMVAPDWNPHGNLQAEGRFHREGATAKEIFIYYLLCPNTLDDRVLELLTTKANEAVALAPHDMGGVHLSADLDSGKDDTDWDIDTLCQMLQELST